MPATFSASHVPPLPRLILSMDGLVLREIVLDCERLTIGRKACNDVCIDDFSISGEHLRITTILGDVFLEDLDSTNGTYVNDKAVTRRVLAPGDVISLGKYRLKYIAPAGQTHTTWADSGRSEKENETDETAALSLATGFYLRVLDGPYAGRLISLNKPRSVLRGPSGAVVAVMRRRDGYALTPLAGPLPSVDGRAADEEVMLAEKTRIDLVGVTLEFLSKP
ncbi:MAG TPA: FHA domain-containing protein [Azoarcus sp.]|nr:FHA domain-containing protein [Azoarcus sp.]